MHDFFFRNIPCHALAKCLVNKHLNSLTHKTSPPTTKRKKIELKIETFFASFLAYGKSSANVHLRKKIGRIGCHENHGKSVEKDQSSSHHHWVVVIWGSSISRHFLYFHLFFNAWNPSKKSLQIVQIAQNIRSIFQVNFVSVCCVNTQQKPELMSEKIQLLCKSHIFYCVP